MKILLKLYPRLNLGDDLFLKMICERYPSTQFFLLGNKEYFELNKWGNLNIYFENNNESLFAKANRVITRKFYPKLFARELQNYFLNQTKEIVEQVDGFVSIGGSIFIQIAHNVCLDNEIAYYQFINERLKQKPKYFIGCNFGPYRSKEYLIKYKEIFNAATDICFRERFSFDIFKGMDNVRLAPDVVFGLDVQQQCKKADTVGFSIVPPRGKISVEVYFKKYAELIKAYQKKNFTISLFSFCKEEGDETAIECILKLLDSQTGISTVYYNGEIDEFLSRYSEMEYMYCGRFHAMILSMLYNQKIFPIVYSNKMSNVLEDIDYKGRYIDMKRMGELDIEETLTQIELNDYNIKQQRVEAHLQFSALDTFLNS